jgi:hypothetical protein
VTRTEAAQRYLGGAGVVRAGPDPGAGGVVGVRVGVGLVVSPGEVVVVSVGDVGLVVSPGDVVVSVGLVVVGVVVVVVVTVSLGLRTLVRGTQV